MKKFLFFLSTLFVANGLMAQNKTYDFNYDGLYYKIKDDGTVGVTSELDSYSIYMEGKQAYENLQGAIIIPSTVVYETNTYDVTSIEDFAFSKCKGVTSVIIPNSVTYIGQEAFLGTQITSIIIPDSVTYMGRSAFAGCNKLTSITSPKNKIDECGLLVFYGCTSLTSLTFAKDNFWAGNCFSSCTGLTSVVIPNGVTYVDAFLECTNLSSVTIPNSVTEIGAYAFKGCSSLTSIVLPENVEKIGEHAFYGCDNLAEITCYSARPPELACSLSNQNVFENYNLRLYVPCESLNIYSRLAGWRDFESIECIESETVELQKDEVKVEPEKTEAVFSMPTNESAYTYTLTIQNNGVTFCTLTFNSQGQLANIDFSTTKSYELKAGVSGYQFTVTGLSEATNYGYSFKALASNKSVLKEYTGSFTTKNEDGTGGSSQGGTSTAINGVSNAAAVTIVNNQILVNGEAPAFVVTVSGQKIANANLKAGVYFVVADGETVGVSVR